MKTKKYNYTTVCSKMVNDETKLNSMYTYPHVFILICNVKVYLRSKISTENIHFFYKTRFLL